ncbi:MAG: LPS assembly protein LptD [Desulfovibrio sp.]|jgi:LPS-assembly protein|nr:LPS assembly protein LptD [Desulfovibrio sp.]
MSPMPPSFRVLFLLALPLLFCFPPVMAPRALAADARPLVMQTEDERLVRWDLSADSVTTYNDNEIMEARGNVFLRRGSEYLKADFARYYMSSHWVYLKGNIAVRTGRDEIQAEEAEFDLRSRVGWLKKGRIFLSGPHAYISGEFVNKHWGDMYTFKRATVTTCDGDSPAWSFSADEAVVEIDGYARLTHSTFQVKDTPVAYTPYFILPVKTKRQTGFLMPEYGQSDEKGLTFTLPFFWAIDDSNDMTFSETWMEKRGFLHGLEARSRPSDDTAGWIRLDWLYDTRRITSEDQGAYDGDGLVRNNRERYWLRGMYDTRLPNPDWRFKADLDFVSDPEFLREFKHGFGGFDRNREALFAIFSRDLREKYEDRVSGLLLTRDWQRGSLALSAQYTQNIRVGNGNIPYNEDTTLQRLPQVDAFLHKGRILPSLPLEAEGSFQAAYLYRRAGTRGARYQASPRLTLPLASRYGSLIASAGLVQTLYDTENPGHTKNLDRYDPRTPKEDGTSATVPDVSIAASTEFARVFDLEKTSLRASNGTLGASQWTALRHSVQPRLEYRQRPWVDQDDNPYYDAEDRLAARSELVYSLTNVLTARSQKVVMRQNDAGEARPALEDFYREILRMRLEQAYDFREATRRQEKDRYERRPFGDILMDLTVFPWENIALETRDNWSPYLGKVTRHQSYLRFFLPEYGDVYLGYDQRTALDEYRRDREDDLRYLTLGGGIVALDPLQFSFSFRKDLEDTDNTETEIRVIYNHQCFQILASVIMEPEERSYHLSVVLTGLGD